MNTKTLAQLLNDCDYQDNGTLEAALALSFFVAGASAAMLMARRGDPADEIHDQLDTLAEISRKNLIELMKWRKLDE